MDTYAMIDTSWDGLAIAEDLVALGPESMVRTCWYGCVLLRVTLPSFVHVLDNPLCGRPDPKAVCIRLAFLLRELYVGRDQRSK